MRIRIEPGFWTSRIGLAVLGSALLLFVVATSVFAYYYIQFGKLINQQLTGQVYHNTSRVFRLRATFTPARPCAPATWRPICFARGTRKAKSKAPPENSS